jgi:hypothetical protein
MSDEAVLDHHRLDHKLSVIHSRLTAAMGSQEPSWQNHDLERAEELLNDLRTQIYRQLASVVEGGIES